MSALILLGLIAAFDLLAGLYYRRAFRTISLKMILEHLALILVLLSAFIFIPGAPPELLMLAEAVLIYYDYEQLHTGHTILNIWERRFILGIVTVWMLLFMGLGITGYVFWGTLLVRFLYIALSFADRFVKKVRGTEIELSDLEEQALRTALTVKGGYKGKKDSASFVILGLSAIQVLSVSGSFGICGFPAVNRWFSSLGLYMAKPGLIPDLTPLDRLLYVCIGFGVLFLIVHSPILSLLKIDYYEFVNIDGVLPNLLLEGRSRLMDTVPYGYSEEAVKETVGKYPGEKSYADSSSEMPDIIVVMNESFADLRAIGGFDVSRPVMPYFDSLKNDPEVITGLAHVSVLGGNTAYSEYEFLTGDSTRFYRHCPYSSKVIPPGLTIHGLPSHLKDLGYRTVACHSYLRENWRRPVVYSAMGFEEQYYIDDFPADKVEKVRSFCSDESHYREIIRRLEEYGEDRPLFFFNVTMQNHGGYAPDTDLPDRIGVGPRAAGALGSRGEEAGGPSEAGTYETLVNISDSAIHVLTDHLASRKRPCILLFFGDHQPKLPSAFMESVLGHAESLMTEEERNRLYVTPYFIRSNSAFGKLAGSSADKDPGRSPGPGRGSAFGRTAGNAADLHDISLNYLGVYLMRLAGLPLTGYMQYLEKLMTEQPVFTRREGAVPPGYENLIYDHIRGGEKGAEGFFGSSLPG